VLSALAAVSGRRVASVVQVAQWKCMVTWQQRVVAVGPVALRLVVALMAVVTC
jgi:hypothetical protein